MNINNLSRVVIGVALVLVLVVLILLFVRRDGDVPGITADGVHTSVVVVASGDTLSKLLTDQGFTNAQVLEIAKVLKSDADITSLRAARDKLEFVRPDADSPVSKVVIIPSPWRRVEITCTPDGVWQCNTIDIQPDKRAVYRA